MRCSRGINPISATRLALAAVVACLLLGQVTGCGCGCRRRASRSTDRMETSEMTQTHLDQQQGDIATSVRHSGTLASGAMPVTHAAPPSTDHNRIQEADLLLREAVQMMRSGNHEGALRRVQRAQQDNPTDPHIGMQASYLQAMLYHRMRDPRKRKEAMDAMLKNMEALQQEPAFRAAHEEGREGQELMRLTLEKAGNRYDTD